MGVELKFFAPRTPRRKDRQEDKPELTLALLASWRLGAKNLRGRTGINPPSVNYFFRDLRRIVRTMRIIRIQRRRPRRRMPLHHREQRRQHHQRCDRRRK